MHSFFGAILYSFLGWKHWICNTQQYSIWLYTNLILFANYSLKIDRRILQLNHKPHCNEKESNKRNGKKVNTPWETPHIWHTFRSARRDDARGESCESEKQATQYPDDKKKIFCSFVMHHGRAIAIIFLKQKQGRHCHKMPNCIPIKWRRGFQNQQAALQIFEMCTSRTMRPQVINLAPNEQ
jgi:hypothetical protein